MGRKPLSDIRKFAVLTLRLTEDEREELDAAALAAGSPTSTWARDLLLAAARATPEATPAKKPKAKAAKSKDS